MLVPTFTAMNIVKFGSPAQQERYVKPFVDGRVASRVDPLRADAGSDAAAAAKTHAAATRTLDWIVSGSEAVVQWRRDTTF
ncbi:acyl-CoA dehydrogenase family protein [Pseudonocardia sp. MCCB 268]|nr:acyl-CoA dehydrogenase family protein [Pseudonocardia cytotoxica]